MNTFIRQKAEETDRQTDEQTNNVNSIKQYKRNELKKRIKSYYAVT